MWPGREPSEPERGLRQLAQLILARLLEKQQLITHSHTLLELGDLGVGGLRELNVGDGSTGDSSHDGEQTGNSSVLHCVDVDLGFYLTVC